MALLAPSILSADFGNLTRDFEMINNSQADWFHFDVMDGVFVPNISFGFPILDALKKVATKPIDVHLMVHNPDPYIETFAKKGAEIITVHYETCKHLHRTIQLIKSTGAKAGVVLNPHTPVSVLQNILNDLDMVLIMSVNPGFGGQKFIPAAIDKVRELRALAAADLLIEVDGGVNLDNCQTLINAGANVLVAGSAVFNTPNPTETIAAFKAKMG
ncbi:MAG: ribulose-phosphate 3-epimerase [Bacteroidetes bacterium]|nr:ribulose-phosphate 3-epimerase [Bacteroidota bacterium]